MYASDLTLKKRNQVIFSDVSRQKALFEQGAIFRMNYQKGGTDYSYMMELEQGCINNKCLGIAIIQLVHENAATHMDIARATYIDVIALNLNEYGYPIYVDSNGNSIALDLTLNTFIISSPSGTVLQTGIPQIQMGSRLVPSVPFSYVTSDDVYIPIPMGSTKFYFFGNEYNSSSPMYWSTNNSILFQDPQGRVVSVNRNSEYPRSLPGNPPFMSNGAILLGNFDRRLDKFYVRDDSISGKYSILTLLVFYEDSYNPLNNQYISTPNTGEYQIRIIRELTAPNRQWVEVRVLIAPFNVGYIQGDPTTDTDPINTNNQLYADSTKLSPYNITDGNNFLNPCGTIYSTVGPASGTSFAFESDSTGKSWVFSNNSYLPV